MTKRRFSSTALTCGALAACGVAIAAPASATPITVGIGDSLSAPVLATSPRHGSTVAWRDNETGTLFARHIFPAGRLGPLRTIAMGTSKRPQYGPWIATARTGATLAVWFDDQLALRARWMSPRGSLRPDVEVAPPGAAGNAASLADVALDDRGNATIAWQHSLVEYNNDPHASPFYYVAASIHARRVSGTGRLGPTVDLPPSGGIDIRPRVFMSGNRVTIAWEASGTGVPMSLRMASVGSSGAVGPVRDLPFSYSNVDLAANARGDITLAGTAVGPDEVVARPIRASGFAAPRRVLGPIDVSGFEGPILGVDVAVDGAGEATVVWQHWIESSAPDPILARRIDRDGKVSRLWALTQAFGAEEPVVAVGRTGTATVVWVREAVRYTRFAIKTRAISRHGRLGPVRTVAPGTASMLAGLSVVADARGIVTAAWIDEFNPDYPQSSITVARLRPRFTRP